MSNNKICIGNIVGPHGLDGHVKIKCFLENPEDIAEFDHITDALGRGPFHIELVGKANKNFVRAKIQKVTSRDMAEKLINTDIYIDRDALPDIDNDTFYFVDLIGMHVYQLSDHSLIGKVIDIENHGAQDLLCIASAHTDKEHLIPYIESIVISIDQEAQKIIIDPPAGLLDL